MSTRTIISARMKEKVYAIYCHHDGYAEDNAPEITHNMKD